MDGLEIFTDAVIEAMYFCETSGDFDIPADAKMSDETDANLRADCRSFWRRCGVFVRTVERENNAYWNAAKAGHDFWMTRNGHGCGFWDGGWDDTPYASMLNETAIGYGPFNIYLGDDGEIWA